MKTEKRRFIFINFIYYKSHINLSNEDLDTAETFQSAQYMANLVKALQIRDEDAGSMECQNFWVTFFDTDLNKT